MWLREATTPVYVTSRCTTLLFLSSVPFHICQHSVLVLSILGDVFVLRSCLARRCWANYNGYAQIRQGGLNFIRESKDKYALHCAIMKKEGFI